MTDFGMQILTEAKVEWTIQPWRSQIKSKIPANEK